MDVNENIVLAFCSTNLKLRESIRKSLAMASYKIYFASTIDEVAKQVISIKPAVFIHDWAATEESQGRAFQFRIEKLDTYREISRVLIVEQVNTSIQAFASDANIDLVVSHSNALNIGQTLSMNQMSGISELQKFLRRMKSNKQEYDQNLIDEKVKEAFEKFPHDDKVVLEYSNLTYRRKQYEETCKFANQLLSKNSNNLRAANVLSRALMKMGKFDEASSLLETSHALSPENPDRLLILGEAFYGKGDLEKALGYFEEAHTMDVQNIDAVKGIGQIKFVQGKIEEVIDLFRGSLSEDESASFFNNSAVSSVKKNNIREAVKLYETALKALSTSAYKPVILTNMAITCMRVGDYEKAGKCIRLALKIDPEYEKAQRQNDILQKKLA